MASILIVDDEANIRLMLARLLESEGHDVDVAADGEEGLALVEGGEPDVVLLDLALPGVDGIEVLRSIRHRHPALPVVMMSGRATLADAVQATKVGAFHFIEKPLSPESVLLTVESAVALRRARELSRQLAEDLRGGERLIGSSAAMRETRELLAQVAATDARVLITGESGTGKELAAAVIHELSARAGGPFVPVNSAAIPRELVESEMFGHARGAFTGAVGNRRGRFELAHGGTLFLDEVADLDAGAQSKLLRALETGWIERVGSERGTSVDVRVVAATHRHLEAEVEAGRFREDLYYRLNVLPVRMPPLRERPEDVPEIVEHFIGRLRARDGLALPRIETAAMRLLRAHDWPGNVRELANLCERLVILHAGATVDADDVIVLLGGKGGADPADEAPLADRLDRYERDVITRALAAADGSVAEAARRLQTDRANLYRRMRRLGIEP